MRHKFQNKDAGYRATVYDQGETIAVAFSSDFDSVTVLNFFSDPDEAACLIDKFCEVTTNSHLLKQKSRQLDEINPMETDDGLPF